MKLLFCLMASCAALVATSCAKPGAKPEAKPSLVKAEVFERRYQRVDMPETMHVTKFLGIQDGVAILSVSDKRIIGKGWKEEIIGVKIDDLDPAFRTEVEEAAAALKAK